VVCGHLALIERKKRKKIFLGFREKKGSEPSSAGKGGRGPDRFRGGKRETAGLRASHSAGKKKERTPDDLQEPDGHCTKIGRKRSPREREKGDHQQLRKKTERGASLPNQD